MADEIEPFATADDLRARWPDMPVGSENQADRLLLDASEMMLAECSGTMKVSANTRQRIACAVVRRAMQADAADVGGFAMAGMESWQGAAGPMSMGGKVANPHGDMYLTKQERRTLGCGAQRAFSVDLLAGVDVS